MVFQLGLARFLVMQFLTEQLEIIYTIHRLIWLGTMFPVVFG